MFLISRLKRWNAGSSRSWKFRRISRRRRRLFDFPVAGLESLEPRVLMTVLSVRHLAGTETGTNASVSVSDDGRHMAFVSDANLTGQNTELRPSVFYFDTSDSTYTQVTDAPSLTSDVVMSGDGSRIAFVTAADLVGRNTDGNFEVFLYDIPSQRFFQLTNTFDPQLKDTPDKTNLWLSKDGTRLMYQAFRSNIQDGIIQDQLIRVTNLTTTPTSSVVIDFQSAWNSRVSHLSYSRDGSHVAVDSFRDLTGSGTNADGNAEIFLIDIRSEVISITQVTDTLVGSNTRPTLNGDGTYIAFTSDVDFMGGGELFSLDQLYLHDRLSSSFTLIPNTARGGIATLDATGNRLISQNLIGSYIVFDSQTSEFDFLGGGPGLPVPSPVPPMEGSGIPPIIPIVEGLGATAISANGRFMGFTGFVGADDARTSGIFFVTEQFPPIVVADHVMTPEDTNIEFNVLENDSDPNGGTLSVLTLGGEETHGRVTFNNNGKLIYRPDDNFFGKDSFTYVAENSAGLKTRGTVFVEVLPVNDPPDTVADQFDIYEDTDAFIAGPAVLLNDTDLEGDPLTAKLISGPIHGMLTFYGNGSFRYVPDENFNGIDAFVYVANDGVDNSAETVVMLNVLAVNDRPVNGLPDPVTAFEDVPASIIGITVTDSDVAEGTGVLQVTLQVTNGTLTVDESVIGGLAAADIQGNGTSTVILTGVQERINTTLAAETGLIYLGGLDFSGDDSLSITTNDLGGFGLGGPMTASDVLPIRVLSSAQQAEHITAAILELSQLSIGVAKSLSQKIERVRNDLEDGQDAASIRRLRALTNELHALALSSRITESEEEALIKSVETLVTSISTTENINATVSPFDS